MTTEAQDLAAAGGIPPSDFSSDPSRVIEIAEDELFLPQDLPARVAAELTDFVIDADVVTHAVSALVAGHLVLQGPPGTGKTALAQKLAHAFNARLEIATAHEDWTTYDVIGRQEIRAAAGAESVVPVDGHVTSAILACANQFVAWEDADDKDAEPQAVWLLVDELNRAQFDRAFGEMFTALGTEALVQIRLGHRPGKSLVVPHRFRIIATLNSIDRQFVQNLSQALRRRFSFVTVDTPPPKPLSEAWTREPSDGASLAVREYAIVLAAGVRQATARLTLDEGNVGPLEELLDSAEPNVRSLFDIVQQLRSGTPERDAPPYLPVGTATLIDVLGTFLIDVIVNERSAEAQPSSLDWASALRIAPLLEAEVLEPEQLEAFAATLPAPFDGEFATSLRRTAALGLRGV